MNVLRIFAGLAIIIGAGMIVFARPLGALYEGGSPTMSDLGFIAGGVMIFMLGLILLLGLFVVTIVRRRH